MPKCKRFYKDMEKYHRYQTRQKRKYYQKTINAPTIIEAEPTQSNAPNTLDVLTNTCPFCGGTLSEIRTDGKKKWRHCYSCHMEQEVQDSA